MTRQWFLAEWMIVAGIAASPACAQRQPAADDGQALGRCLKLRTTGQDRLVVMRWLVAGLASAPQVADVVAPRAGAKAAADRDMATLFTRLLTVDCAADARPLFKAGDMAGFKVAGGALGTIAVEELLTDPKAAAALGDYAKLLRQDDFTGVVK